MHNKMVCSVLPSGGTSPSSLSTHLEKYETILTIPCEDLTVDTGENCYQGGPAKWAKLR